MPLGVVGPPPQPVIPMDASVAIRIALLTANRSLRSFRFFAPRSGSSRNAARAPAIAIGCCEGDRPDVDREASDRRAAGVAFTSVAMVSVDVAIPETVGVMLDEEKVQVAFFGRPLHARVVAALKPFNEVTVTVTTAFLPALKEPVAESSVNVKAGAPGHSVTPTGEEVDDALLVSPPKLAVML